MGIMTESKHDRTLWDRTISRLEKELPASQFDAYVRPVKWSHRTDQELVLTAPDEFVKSQVLEVLAPKIQTILEEIFSVSLPITVQVLTEDRIEQPGASPRQAPTRIVSLDRSGLNPKYSLENYVVGDANMFAYRASQAVVKGLGSTYNPFFIWGAVGVGKTHLMQAIGHAVLDENQERSTALNVKYVTAESFINEWFEAIQEGKNATQDFRKRYRNVDLLMLDDVQFFEKKESMQEAFFYTFNELYQKRKQIVLTSDRPPKQLDRLEERLVNRFESGLTVPIQPPLLETRILILEKLARERHVAVDSASLQVLAENVEASVRELEGAFTKVTAYSSLLGVPITESLVREIIKEFSTKSRVQRLDADLIIRYVAEYYNLKAEELRARRQTRVISGPRQVAMYLIHELIGTTLKETGILFGKKDHTTVLYACDKIRKALDDDIPLARDVKLIKIKIKETTRQSATSVNDLP